MTGDRVHPAARVAVGCLSVVISVGVVAVVFLVLLPLLGVTLTVTGIVLAIALAASIMGIVLAGIGEIVIRAFRRARAGKAGVSPTDGG